MLISLGLVGPKARPKGVVDGQQVNIPVPNGFSDGGTQYAKRPGDWKCRAKAAGCRVGKSARREASELMGLRVFGQSGFADAMLPRKASKRLTTIRPYRKPTQAGKARSLRCAR